MTAFWSEKKGSFFSGLDLRSLLELTPDGVVGINPQGQITVVNAKAEELFGRRAKEMVGVAVESLIPKLFSTSELGHLSVYMSEPKQRDMGTGLELFGLRQDGTRFPVELASTPHRMDGRQVVLVFVRDISARKAVEEAVVHREQELSEIIHTALDAVVGIDSEGSSRAGTLRPSRPSAGHERK